ncbi:fluoride efflux transporter CrcB [Gloeothece verrucosa]|uniref:Fluoride-specific ion channel FluC n=1 Tax=Gloeothece verrucosa (strain PCC 7822) TaxID=497965 RepID=E0UEC0_GLOV7|nr:fluoride efflux transporter CrcB [Gloeothece verrucosa]ADN15366.1 CrcB protein [Gloeothece verrucosa PCC 7822]
MLKNSVTRAALAVAIGAIPGALSRYYITEYTKSVFGKDFAYYGTFFINVTGCLIIAYLLTLAAERIRNFSPELRLMLTTGFCGAYTTFSTFGLETRTLLDKGDSTTLIYWLGSIIVGMLGVNLGVMLARLNQKSSLE